jgi:hypothetical protein
VRVWRLFGIRVISHSKRHKGSYPPAYRPQLAAMHKLEECQHCSGGTQYNYPGVGWGKIPPHMLHKVREESGDIVFNAEPLFSGIRDCNECTGRGGVYRYIDGTDGKENQR